MSSEWSSPRCTGPGRVASHLMVRKRLEVINHSHSKQTKHKTSQTFLDFRHFGRTSKMPREYNIGAIQTLCHRYISGNLGLPMTASGSGNPQSCRFTGQSMKFWRSKGRKRGKVWVLFVAVPPHLLLQGCVIDLLKRQLHLTYKTDRECC